METVRLGLIGLGGMANVHVEQLLKLEGAVFTAICDSDVRKHAEWGERLGLGASARHSDPEALIRDPNVDAVLSITPNRVHAEIIRLCLVHGKPLMTEKPFTRTFAEAAELLELARSREIPCMVGFSYRYTPSFRMARDMIRGGRIGEVRHVFIQYLQQWGGPLFETPMNWRMDPAVTGTGTLGDLGSHMVDAARFLIGEPIRVSSLMSSLIKERKDPVSGNPVPVDIDDFAAFVAELEPGVPAVFQTSRNAFGAQNQFEISVYGDTGSLHMGWEDGEHLTWVHPNEERSEVREKIAVPERYKLKQMQDFLDLARGKVREETPGMRDGYLNQRVLEAIARSARERRSVAPEEIGAGWPVKEAGR
ncbi:Gfo/Idh/MocA family protein [Cohnella caldifontis]|uniref:Gfo/Idh/MocA family protein n=1 Tax=Cohnella caldifontis TaxID=3027471 RepID=UPI0023EC181E|nr:Gfo/Idh/MocA family oxidoreductase [Cohnella sp. YIM B05605]